MRIGIDGRCFTGGKNTGVEEYARHTMEELFVRHADHTFVVFLSGWKKESIGDHVMWLDQYPHVEVKHVHIPNKLLNLSLWYFRRPYIDRFMGRLDVFFMPNINFVSVSPQVKLLLTMHDLSFERYAHTFSWRRRLWHALIHPRRLARRADHIFAVSEATKNDITHFYDISDGHISVTPNGIPEMREVTRNCHKALEVKARYKLPYNFILYLGTLEPRKNVVNIIRAYDHLRHKNPRCTHKLVLAGAKGWRMSDVTKAIADARHREDIVVYYDIDRDDKASFYVLADVLIYPSFFEGCGLPVLESLSLGVPVITGHGSALPEAGKGRVLMIDPYRTEEMVVALEQFLCDRKVKEQLTKKAQDKGKSRDQWRISARHVMAIAENY